ncbi:MAG: hypothetical protein KatS3mg076_3079 [Candidatus Binatia bacterium]|nr:MAG: hypothetical protein KatS3mg076_3079 [Candidatus Binatia bacterium]
MPEIDEAPEQTAQWIESFDELVRVEGPRRARQLLAQLIQHGYRRGVVAPFAANTPYVNTIPVEDQPPYPGDLAIERRIRNMNRWNAAMMVVRANAHSGGIGGHISTYASLATLVEVGFHHFFRAHTEEAAGDFLYFQGHAAPGIYARAFLEGRLTEQQLANFRRELAPGGGLSSYPHPWLMPHFWEWPTVSMGLSPICSIYQARFLRYLHARGLADTSQCRVWAFLGDGEMDEPESMGAITLASREQLDNLIWVVNCNLQRLDGPVRGNGKIIQELEAAFRGAGWNVIKVIWGSDWDPLLARDTEGLLVKRMNETVDGQYQKYTVESGAYIREHFFGPEPQLRALVADLTDQKLRRLRRGGHDPEKIYAAYKVAVEYSGAPTVILAKTIKGYMLGPASEGRNISHQAKKLSEKELREFRDRCGIPVTDRELADMPFYRPCRRQRGDPVPEGEACRAAGVRTAPGGAGQATPGRTEKSLRGIPGGKRRSGRGDDAGLRHAAASTHERRDDRQARRPHRPRRSPHVRDGLPLPEVRDLFRPGAEVRARRLGHRGVLPGGERRPAPDGRDHGGRGDGFDDRGRNGLRRPGGEHDSLLPFLLDVRLPACR